MTVADAADLVLIHGVVYLADEQDRLCQAVAVRDGRIIFVGGNEEAVGYVGGQTQLIDLQGKMLIPAMMDTHIHPPGLTLSELYEVQLFDRVDLAGYVEAVRAFIAQHPGITSLFGRGWSWGALEGDDLLHGPRKEYLDAVAPDIPVMLQAADGHSLWVNSRALALNGVTKETVAPPGGVIEKDAVSGELRGVLKESAMRIVAWPEYNAEQYYQAMKLFQRKMHAYGITGILCIVGRSLDDVLQACERLERENNLHMHVRAAVVVSSDQDLPAQYKEIENLRRRYHTANIAITTTKFFADGVVEGVTSCLLQPYSPGAGKGEGYCGEFLWDTEELKQAFYLANRQGLQIHVHSTGDGATRHVLDALEDTAAKLPQKNYRNTITHLQLVAKDDIMRFKKMNVIASVQPYWHCKGPKWWRQVDYRILGERAEQEYPLNSFFQQGVVVTSSSDYSITAEPYPLRAMDIGVTRNIDNGVYYGVPDITDKDDERYLLNKEERATVRQMIRSFTVNSAYTLAIEQETGSIEPGKRADLAVLDQNLLAINPVDIDKVKVVMTFFGGKLVYEDRTFLKGSEKHDGIGENG